MFINSKLSVSQIAKRAWLFDFFLSKHAIPIDPNSPELFRVDDGGDWIQLSPFTLAYYLQFLCYHGLRQYHNRDRALRQLVDVVENPEQCGCNCIRPREYKLAGDCCLFVGELARASEMFNKCLESEMKRPVNKWVLQDILLKLFRSEESIKWKPILLFTRYFRKILNLSIWHL